VLHPNTTAPRAPAPLHRNPAMLPAGLISRVGCYPISDEPGPVLLAGHGLEVGSRQVPARSTRETAGLVIIPARSFEHRRRSEIDSPTPYLVSVIRRKQRIAIRMHPGPHSQRATAVRIYTAIGSYPEKELPLCYLLDAAGRAASDQMELWAPRRRPDWGKSLQPLCNPVAEDPVSFLVSASLPFWHDLLRC
jgi:hypothetical protein